MVVIIFLAVLCGETVLQILPTPSPSAVLSSVEPECHLK